MLAESRTRDRKVVTGAVQNKFLLQSELSVLTLIRCPFHPVLPQWHVKDPGHSAKSAGGGLHLNTHSSCTQRSRSRLTMLSRHRVGKNRGHTQLVREHSSTAVCWYHFWPHYPISKTIPLSMQSWEMCSTNPRIQRTNQTKIFVRRVQ